MKLDAEWLNRTATHRVIAALEDAGARAWFVGGCVRDGLLGRPGGDIDIATDAAPDDVMALAKAAGLRAIPTGIDHGTVTVVAEQTPFEVTTLRRDESTDGRYARVAFTDRLEEDAARRDFTINALFARLDGTVLDPLGQGLKDLASRRVRFIGDPADRIREDYLRILRFFRFHSWYADPELGLDPDGLAASAKHAEGLERLSRERVGHEILRLLEAPDPSQSVAAMAHCGVLMRILPGADAAALARLVALEEGARPDAIRRLAALGGEGATEALRLSRAQSRRLARLVSALASVMPPEELGYRLGHQDGSDALRLRAAVTGAPLDAGELAAVSRGATATFPVAAKDLKDRYEGAALGQALSELESRWIASGFKLTGEELLASIDPA